MKFIIEHLEEGFYPWVSCEYNSMVSRVGIENILFTNVKDSASFNGLPTTEKHVWDLDIPLERICLLDLKATETLSPSDADRFDAVVFGGILGDHPPRDRTGCLRRPEFTRRQLGHLQMSTDTAVKVCYEILKNGKRFEELKFRDGLVLETGPNETTKLEFRYLLDANNEPELAPGILDILRADEQTDDFF